MIQTTNWKYAQLVSLVVILFCTLSCRQAVPAKVSQKFKAVDQAGIVSAHPEATEIGLEILKAGGNAIDASIAVQFALAVCYPNAGNIGGGGFLLYRDQAGNNYSLDYREKAPAKSYETMYLDSSGNIIDGLSTQGVMAVGVPGTVDGMYAAFERFSALKDWKALVMPAVELARRGFPLTEQQAKNINSRKKTFQTVNPDYTSPFTVNRTYKKGDLFVQTDLANTMEQIAKHGRAGFYKGQVAQQLLAQMQHDKGIISQEDLDNYKSVWRDPIQFKYKNLDIYSMGPPSSGGILLAQMFQAIEPFPIKSWGFHDSRTMHLMIEAEKRAYADRATHMGDADFYPVPVAQLMDANYVRQRMSDFNMERATAPKTVTAGNVHETEETTHYCVVDKDGNAVSVTTTLNGSYGSKLLVKGAGFLLNNEMDDFSSKVGAPNMYGLVGAEANKIEPNKRMLSSMSPTIVERDGELYIVVGTPGGSTIITSVFQTILNIVEFDQRADEAVAACRFHHQWKPTAVYHEDKCLSAETMTKLNEMGHELKKRSPIGRVEAIVLKNGKLELGADPRGDDHANGY